ncbi:MAG: type IV pilus twitching motility protein PilT, partial [Gammaproteobacteria bacterium]|nr:type IV pilus twitching motility protein PilT [Gammaproteobacteria bacterium]
MELRQLLELCVERRASDLHLSAGLPPWLRVDGELCAVSLPALTDAQVLTCIEECLEIEQRERFRAREEIDLAIEAPEFGRFRLNAFQQRGGAAAVFRAIPPQVLSLAQLGMDDSIARIAELPRGLVVVTGPTGSGKSTTLAAMVDHVNRNRQGHILTIEDPIEFIHESRRCLVTQREARLHTRGFPAALRAALREDPDVILLGELRDPETIRLALTAAETGHLVLATLHTASAIKTVNRIIDVFPAAEKAIVRTQLSESLQAVIAQTLLKKPGGGRVAAREILIATTAVRNLVREDRVAQIYSCMQSGAALGMRTLDQCLAELLTTGQIGLAEARAQARDAAVFGL